MNHWCMLSPREILLATAFKCRWPWLESITGQIKLTHQVCLLWLWYTLNSKNIWASIAAYKKSIRTHLNKSFPFVGKRLMFFFQLILLNLTYSQFGVLLFCIYKNPNNTMNLWFLNLISSFFSSPGIQDNKKVFLSKNTTI